MEPLIRTWFLLVVRVELNRQLARLRPFRLKLISTFVLPQREDPSGSCWGLGENIHHLLTSKGGFVVGQIQGKMSIPINHIFFSFFQSLDYPDDMFSRKLNMILIVTLSRKLWLFSDILLLSSQKYFKDLDKYHFIIP